MSHDIGSHGFFQRPAFTTLAVCHHGNQVDIEIIGALQDGLYRLQHGVTVELNRDPGIGHFHAITIDGRETAPPQC